MTNNGHLSKKQFRWYMNSAVTILVVILGVLASWIGYIGAQAQENQAGLSGIEAQVESIDSRTVRIENKLDALIKL